MKAMKAMKARWIRLNALVCSSLIAAFVSAPVTAVQLDELADYFNQANIVSGPELVECTLSGGSGTTCFQVTVDPDPSTHTPGPWCPGSIADASDHGGIWLENGEVHDVDGAFIENMGTFYADENWQLFDPDTGAVYVTDTLEKCAGAAKPNVEPEYQQHCVECQIEYLDDNATVTYTIPLIPLVADKPSDTRSSGSGLAFNGIRLDAPAPVSDILSNYTLAPFDDCGGHINLAVGYHYHAATDCLDSSARKTDHSNVVGLAMDGYFINARLLSDGSVPEGLDQCGGHASDQLAYHYHAGEQGSNAIVSCLTAQFGCVSEKPGTACNASITSHPDGRPDFAAAALLLGVTEDELLRALGTPPPNFEKAAQALGVTTQKLQEAMGKP